MKITERNSITGETRTRLTYEELGQIMIKACGIARCIEAYQCKDARGIGIYALQYGDINPDGTLN